MRWLLDRAYSRAEYLKLLHEHRVLCDNDVMSTARKPPAASAKPDSKAFSVVKRQDGRFLIGGTEERELVNPDSKLVTKPAPRSIRHLSTSEIKAFVKHMKVAA